MKVNGKTIRTIGQAHQHIINREITCADLVRSIYENINTRSNLNAYVNVQDEERMLEEAEEADGRYQRGE